MTCRSMERIVFLDTNTVIDSSQKTFFWNTQELLNFSKYANIVIPDIVFAERESQIRLKYKEEKLSFLNNLLTTRFRFSTDKIDAFNVDEKIEELKNEIFFKYTKIELTQPEILFKMKDLACNYQPPFEGKNKSADKQSDKWFKDCYLFFTVLEYIESNREKNKKYYIYCRDWKLAEAFKLDWRVNVIQSFEEFKKELFIVDDYLQGTITKYLQEQQGNNIEYNYENFWYNINWNLIISASSPDFISFRVEVDNWEIISDIIEDVAYEIDEEVYSLSDGIKSLCESWWFSWTHFWIKKLNTNINFLRKEEMIKILEAWISNNQIYWLFWDEDVKEFFWKIFEFIKNDIDDDLRTKFTELFW